MARIEQTEIKLRLVIRNPVACVAHSLQDKKGFPIDVKHSATGEPVSFDFLIRVAAGPRFLGEHVRSEGPERRFVYIAVGRQAGDSVSCWDRRMKIDIHDISQVLLDKAAEGGRLVGTLSGTAKDGSPACATVQVETWRVI